MHQDNPGSKKAINVTGVTEDSFKVTPQTFSHVTPHNELHPRVTPAQVGCNSSTCVTAGYECNPVLWKALQLHSEGCVIKLRRIKGRLYLYARKYDREKRERLWIYIGPATDEVINELRKRGILSENGNEGTRKRNSGSSKPSKSKSGSSSSSSSTSASTNTNNTTTQPQPQQPARQPSHGGVGGSWRGSGDGDGGARVKPCRFMVHRLGLRFVKPWVSPLLLQQLGRARYIERSKQWVVRMEVGVKRWLTIQANRDGTAQVFLEASDNPLSLEEFIGFCKFFLPEVMRRATGRQVSLKDFEVMVAPEINCDLDGVKIMEGVKSLTLEEYYEDVVRIYLVDPDEKESMPNGGTRIEVRAESWNGYSLEEIVDGVVSMARLPTVLAEIKKDLELIKGSLPRHQIEMNQLSEAVAAKLANLIYLTFEKWGNRFELALRELGSKLQEALKPLFERIERLERENQELRRRLQELTQQDSSIKFEDLPRDLREFLKELERDGYVRLTETRIAYGDRVWQAILRRKGNIDGWIESESYNYMGREDNRELFKAVIKAIRFYDNRYRGKPGVPYDKFLEALEKFLGSGVTGVTSGYTHNRQHTLNGYIRS